MGEHLKDHGLFMMNNLSTTFRIPKGEFYKDKTWVTRVTRKRLGLQGKDLGYKETTWATRKRLEL